MEEAVSNDSFIIEERVQEDRISLTGPYLYSVLVYDHELSVVFSADISGPVSSPTAYTLFRGEDRGEPVLKVELWGKGRPGGIAATLAIRSPSGAAVGFVELTGGAKRIYDEKEAFAAELRASGSFLQRSIRSLLGRIQAYSVLAKERNAGSLQIQRLPSPEGTGLPVRRWVLTTDLHRTAPELFQLVAAMSIEIVVLDKLVPVRTRLPSARKKAPRKKSIGYRPPPIG